MAAANADHGPAHSHAISHAPVHHAAPAYHAPAPVYRPAPVYKPAPAPVYKPAPAPIYKPAPAPAYKPAPSYHKPTYQEPSYDTPATYQYQYAVADDYSKVDFGASESRDGYATTGEYRVLLPDCRVQVVRYSTADGYSGNVMDVTYEGTPCYDTHPAPSYQPHKPVYHAAPAPVYHKPAPSYHA